MIRTPYPPRTSVHPDMAVPVQERCWRDRRRGPVAGAVHSSIGHGVQADDRASDPPDPRAGLAECPGRSDCAVVLINIDTLRTTQRRFPYYGRPLSADLLLSHGYEVVSRRVR